MFLSKSGRLFSSGKNQLKCYQLRKFCNSQVDRNNLNRIVQNSRDAFKIYREAPKSQVSSFLYQIADNLEADRGEIVNTASEESNLPVPRCEGELTRTTNQLTMFGKLAEEGSWIDARIDGNIRSLLIPLGPVAVFGASNFPLAFSTLGGDTASALAAKCPVVYKTHPGHPKTTDLCNKAIQKAISTSQLPGGVFQITAPEPQSITLDLVQHPLIEAVGFTGSRSVGTLIFRATCNRHKPIPAYCEMGSVNPVFIFPDALKTKNKSLAEGLSGSVTMGVGQFCTNPGLVFSIGDPKETYNFIHNLSSAINAVKPGPMLTPAIFNSYKKGLEDLKKVPGIHLEHSIDCTRTSAGAHIFSVYLEDFLNNAERYQQELFGPSTIIVKCPSVQEITKVASLLEGQLTATFHATENDISKITFFKQFLQDIGEHVGRVVWGGFPTGVEVNSAMHHAGPWPASSDGGRTTSVGTRAILRWVRPLSFQSFPDELLPIDLQESNPDKINRMIKGKTVPYTV